MSSGSAGSTNGSTEGTNNTVTDGYDPIAVMRSFRACCDLARREATSSTFTKNVQALSVAEELLNHFAPMELVSLVAQSEARQDAMPKLRDACSRASRKLQKLNKVSAMKRTFGYNTNVKDAIAHLANQATLVADLLAGAAPPRALSAPSHTHTRTPARHAIFASVIYLFA